MVAERFDLVIEQASRLAGRRLMQAGFDTSLNLHVGGGPPAVIWSRPDQEDFRAFLVDLRPFISAGEPVFLDRVYSLIECHVTDRRLRDEARASREKLRAVESGDDLREANRSPAQIADAYIAETFHVDPDTRRRTQRNQGIFADMEEWFVHHYCSGVARRVEEVASIVRSAVAAGAIVETPLAGSGRASLGAPLQSRRRTDEPAGVKNVVGESDDGGSEH
jgi:hypothetical protein